MNNSRVSTKTAWGIIHEIAKEATALVIQEVIQEVVVLVAVVAVDVTTVNSLGKSWNSVTVDYPSFFRFRFQLRKSVGKNIAPMYLVKI